MPRKLVRRRIRREFPRILYFSEVYDSSYMGAYEGRREEEGRRMTGEVIWSKPRASGKGTSSSGKVKFLRHPRGRFIVSMRRHTMTQFKKK